MKTKSFQKYIEKRLGKERVHEIEKEAALEVKIFKSLQDLVTSSLESYMEEHEIGFNELVRRLDASPTQVAKMRRGEANLTLSSLAHLFATLGKEPLTSSKQNKR